MTGLMKKIARKLLTRPVTPRTTAPMTNRARLGCETFESRVVPAATQPNPTISITAITSTADTDGLADEHVTIKQGSAAGVAVGFSYANLTTGDSVTASIPNAQLTSAPVSVSAGNGSGTILLDVSSLTVGSHNVRVALANANKSDTDGSAIEVEVAITVVSTTTTVAAPDATYDGAPHGATATVTPGAALAAGTLTYAYTGTGDTVYSSSDAPIDAGTYNVVATFTPATTAYSGSSGATDYAIAKAGSSIAGIDDVSVTYDGAAHGVAAPAVTGAGGLNALATLHYTGTLADGTSYDSDDAPVNAGTYTVTATYAGDANHNAAADVTATITIAKADATVTVVDYSGIYDGASHTASVTITGVNGEILASDSVSRTNAGSDSVTASISDLLNYNDVSDTATIDIAKKQITGSFTAANKVYDGTTTASVTGTALSGVIGSDAVALVVTADFADKNVGTGKTVSATTFGLTGAAADNYDIVSVAPTTANITAKALGDFTAGGTQAALDLAKQGTVSFALTVGGIAEGDSLAQLFNGATFTLSMKNATGGYEAVTIGATATVVDGVVYVNMNLKGNTTFYNFLAQGLDAGETSASKANWETINLSATTIGGNYTLSEDVLTRIFKSTK